MNCFWWRLFKLTQNKKGLEAFYATKPLPFNLVVAGKVSIGLTIVRHRYYGTEKVNQYGRYYPFSHES